LIRLHVLTAALALLLVGLLACNGEADMPAEEGQLTDEETRYLVTANRILADSNASFGSIRRTLIGIETANDSAVAPLAEQLQEMNEEATSLEPPGRFSEEHSLLLTALGRMAQIAEQVATAMEEGDEESIAAAGVRAEEAFDLLKQASAAFIQASAPLIIEEGRR
jgi:hypothetical protein